MRPSGNGLPQQRPQFIEQSFSGYEEGFITHGNGIMEPGNNEVEEPAVNVEQGVLKGNDGIVEPGSNGIEDPNCLGRSQDCQTPEGPITTHSTNECQAHEDSHTKNINEGDLVGDKPHSQIESDIVEYPPGFEPHLFSGKEILIPPAFEDITKRRARSGQRSCKSKTHIDSSRKRVTRIQSKKCKAMVGRRKLTPDNNVSGVGGKEDSPLQSESLNTTASVRKLAEESIEIGELLGLKVVVNKENAIKRITDSLKKARIQKATNKSK